LNYFLARVACGAPQNDSGGVEVVLDNPSNKPVAGFSLANTGGWSSWQSVGANMAEITGIHNVYIVLASGGPIPYMSDQEVACGGTSSRAGLLSGPVVA
jgi:hypothetical protein